MVKKITALLVHDQAAHMRPLEEMLRQQGTSIQHAETCQVAAEVLARFAPLVVFTDTRLPDGRWTDVIELAEGATQPANVIVVGRTMDTRLYVEAIEGGAFDFIVPPFATLDLAHVVRCAADNALDRREASPYPSPTAASPRLSLGPTPLGKAGASPLAAEASGSQS